jgi:metallo-beta-lactamase family protein
MEIQFVGAAQTVTGSMHLVRTKHATVLLDCGLFQGTRRESFERQQAPAQCPCTSSRRWSCPTRTSITRGAPDARKNGYTGPIYATPATRDLCAVMLRDAAAIQESDARFLNRHNERDGIDARPSSRSTTTTTWSRRSSASSSVPYHTTIPIAPGVELTFIDAGHVLGSAVTVLDVEEDGQEDGASCSRATSAATTDPSCATPRSPDGADVLITESTYGDRLHDNRDKMDEDLAKVVNRPSSGAASCSFRRSRSSARRRSIFALKKLREEGRDPERAGLRRLAAHREDHRHLQAPPRVLRRRDARADARRTTRPSTSPTCAYVEDVEELQGHHRQPRARRS